MKDMRVRDLKKIISDLPDDMVVVIPIIGEDDVNKIFGFRKVRTAGILSCSSDINREALCINTAEDGYDISDQLTSSVRVHLSLGRGATTREVLYRTSDSDDEDETSKWHFTKPICDEVDDDDEAAEQFASYLNHRRFS